MPRRSAACGVCRSFSEPTHVATDEGLADHETDIPSSEKPEAEPVQLSLIYDPTAEILHVVVHQIPCKDRVDGGDVELQVLLFPNSGTSEKSRIVSPSAEGVVNEEFSFHNVTAPLGLERSVLKIRLLDASTPKEGSAKAQTNPRGDKKSSKVNVYSKPKRNNSDTDILRWNNPALKVGMYANGPRKIYSESDLMRMKKKKSVFLSNLAESQNLLDATIVEECSSLAGSDVGEEEGKEPAASGVKCKHTRVHSLPEGEGFLELGRFRWSKGALVHHSNVLLRGKPRLERSTSEKHLERGLGQVFVLIQNQSYSSRLKVFVAWATHLPRSDKLLGNPGHYLVVKLQQGDKVVVEKRTKTRPGNNPIWNEPFLFSLEHDDLLSFSLHLIVMRRRHYAADSVLDHVTIGANQIHNGARHWQDVCRRPGREVARWHSVLPVFAY
ncbi:hypothetical protein BaRGS_00005215 [Batillaria attramentaria]|uniref:C2 domain-containing protein n=1 Tax=Batillaria attramentaria TaxID=370345 RepID=A0ABD0LWX8_9CAEN